MEWAAAILASVAGAVVQAFFRRPDTIEPTMDRTMVKSGSLQTVVSGGEQPVLQQYSGLTGWWWNGLYWEKYKIDNERCMKHNEYAH